MGRRLTFFESKGFDPYFNLATEEYLMFHCGEEECILYLWQNRHTVVIGRNQDPRQECGIKALEADGGHLARRNSGGGAVYHDLGNLNFSFLTRSRLYDVERQLLVIKKTIESFGIKAQVSGRNDVTIDGRKFSGNAFYEYNDLRCHHGTLMVNVDIQLLPKYLTVSDEKLRSHGVASSKARVANLSDFIPQLDIKRLKAAIREAYEDVYDMQGTTLDNGLFDREEINSRRAKFASPEWIYGSPFKHDYEMTQRFEWGDICIRVQVTDALITQIAVHTDSMDTEFAGKLREILAGVRYEKEAICEAIDRCHPGGTEEARMKNDILEWMDRQITDTELLEGKSGREI